MRFTTTTILALLSATAFAAPAADSNIVTRRAIGDPCWNLGMKWCMDGQIVTCYPTDVFLKKGKVITTGEAC